MERSTLPGAAVVFALLVVVSPVTGAAGPAVGTAGPAVAAGDALAASASSAGPPAPTNNTSARLVLPAYRVEQAQFETVTVGMASTLQAGTYGARAEHRRIDIEREFSSADSVGEKRSVVDRALIGLNGRVQALVERERATIRAYSNGNVSAATVVRRLARIDSRARELRATLELVRDLTTRIPTDDFETRIRDLSGMLAPLTGPVRERVSHALSGERTSVRVHVVASDQGVVLSMLVGGEYVREATDWRNRNASGQRELETTEQAREHAGELYQWVVTQKGRTGVGWEGDGIWRWSARHSQGELVALIDASTTDVYREVQRLTVDEMPAPMTVVRTRDGLRIALQRTYPGGPLRILVEDASTDAVVNANVAVDGHELGYIGADGVVMTLEPRPPYTVNVTAGESSVVVAVDRPFDASVS